MPSALPQAWYGAALLVLAACDRSAFDHSRAHGRLEADASPESCGGAGEGDPWDDRDICTPRSVCRAGACFGENPFETCVVADTVDDFSSEQGKNGWFYGYWDAANDPDGRYDPASDFKPMEYCRENTW